LLALGNGDITDDFICGREGPPSKYGEDMPAVDLVDLYFPLLKGLGLFCNITDSILCFVSAILLA
jgi:hypothetical protein